MKVYVVTHVNNGEERYSGSNSTWYNDETVGVYTNLSDAEEFVKKEARKSADEIYEDIPESERDTYVFQNWYEPKYFSAIAADKVVYHYLRHDDEYETENWSFIIQECELK